MSWCNPHGVSVFIAQVRLGGAWAGMYMRHIDSYCVCEVFYWCCGGI